MSNVDRAVGILNANGIGYESVVEEGDGVRVTWTNRWSAHFSADDITQSELARVHAATLRIAASGCHRCSEAS